MGRGGDELRLTPGQRLTITESTPERLVVEAVYDAGGTPPPAHFHPGRTEEWFRAIDALHKRTAEGNAEPQEFVDLLHSYDDVIRVVMPPSDGV